MKKYVTLCIAVLAILKVSAQLPIIEPNKTWNIARCNSAVPVCTTLFYKFEDTLEINGKNYTKILTSELSNPDNWQNTGYIRDDGTGKTYYLTNSNSKETLLYDFSMNVGDTVVLESVNYGQCCPSKTSVDSIKNIDYNDITRKTLYVSSLIQSEGSTAKTNSVWIEGIGSKLGLLQPTECLYTGAYFYLLCCNTNNQLIYKNPTASSCTITAITNNELQKDIKIRTNSTNIEIENNSKYAIYVLFVAVDGRILNNTYIPQNSTKTVSTSKFSKGICIVTIYSESESYSSKIFIP